MSVKVEVNLEDARMLALLIAAKARGCMSWDVNIPDGVTMKVEIAFPIGTTVPAVALDSVNACIAACNKAFAESAVVEAP